MVSSFIVSQHIWIYYAIYKFFDGSWILSKRLQSSQPAIIAEHQADGMCTQKGLIHGEFTRRYTQFFSKSTGTQEIISCVTFSLSLQQANLYLLIPGCKSILQLELIEVHISKDIYHFIKTLRSHLWQEMIKGPQMQNTGTRSFSFGLALNKY